MTGGVRERQEDATVGGIVTKEDMYVPGKLTK